MGIFNWFSKNKAQSANKGKITAKQILDFSKTYEELQPYFALFVNFFKYVLDSEKEIEHAAKEIQSKTQQNLKEDQLSKELWILRYVCLHIWFFDLKPPKNKTELSDELLTINSALKSVLKQKDKLDYLPWLKNGLSEFADGELNFNSLENLRKNFSDKLAGKIPQIAFDSTEGRLGGELHDFVIELVMTTIQEDQKVFSMRDNETLTEEETKNVKNVIAEINDRKQKTAKAFMESLG